MAHLLTVKTIATENISPLSSEGQTAGDYILLNNDRVILSGQSTQTENGVWIVNSSGDWTRALDFQAGLLVEPGTTIFVTHGKWARYEFFVDENREVTVGIDSISFSVARGPGIPLGQGPVVVDWPYVGLRASGVQEGDVNQPNVRFNEYGLAESATPGGISGGLIEGLNFAGGTDTTPISAELRQS